MIYGLTSIAGAPGVSTTAVAWATTAGTPTLLLEADMTGGSPILAGRFRSEVPHERTILAMATRRQDLTAAETLRSQAVPLPSAMADSSFVATIAEHQQAAVLQPAWGETADALHEIAADGGLDVLIDLGRITTNGGPWALLERLDALIVLSGTTLPALITLANGLPRLQDQLHSPLVAVGFIESHMGGYSPGEAGRVITAPVVGSLPYAPRAAAVYSIGHQGTRASVLRGYHQRLSRLRTSIAEQTSRHREVLLGERS